MNLDHQRTSLLALVAVLGVGCGGSGGGGGGGDPIGPPGPPPATIAITTATSPPPRFIPVSATLAVGGTVTWTNASTDQVLHDLVATTPNWQLSRTLGPGESFQTSVSQAGTYRYMCTIHQGMIGAIEVR